MRTLTLLTFALLGACTPTWGRTITTIRPGNIVRLALQSTEARSCSERCTTLGENGDVGGVMTCLEACPGSEVKFGSCEPSDRFPDAICVAAPETKVSKEESGTCAERATPAHVACHDHADYHADGRIWLWLLSVIAIVPVIAVEN